MSSGPMPQFLKGTNLEAIVQEMSSSMASMHFLNYSRRRRGETELENFLMNSSPIWSWQMDWTCFRLWFRDKSFFSKSGSMSRLVWLGREDSVSSTGTKLTSPRRRLQMDLRQGDAIMLSQAFEIGVQAELGLLEKLKVIHWGDSQRVGEQLFGFEVHLVGKECFLVCWSNFKKKNSAEAMDYFSDDVGWSIKCWVLLGFEAVSKVLRITSFTLVHSFEVDSNGGNISTVTCTKVICKPEWIFDHIDCHPGFDVRVQIKVCQLLFFCWSD